MNFWPSPSSGGYTGRGSLLLLFQAPSLLPSLGELCSFSEWSSPPLAIKTGEVYGDMTSMSQLPALPTHLPI